jgi:hypothetical protein
MEGFRRATPDGIGAGATIRTKRARRLHESGHTFPEARRAAALAAARRHRQLASHRSDRGPLVGNPTNPGDTEMPRLPFAAAVAAVACTLPAQETSRAQDVSRPEIAGVLRNLRIPIHEQVDASRGTTELWCGGAAYKASFHDGLQFHVPGRTAPFRWRTETVRAGGVQLPLQAARPAVAPFRCSYELGPVREVYDVRSDGIEQTFVLSPSLEGDVEIVGTVDSPAAAAAPADAAHQALRFAADGEAYGVGYGAATAIDGNGRTLPLTSEYGNGRITLRVPGAWLATAAQPVVVDPLLSPVMVSRVANNSGQEGQVVGVAVERDDVAGTSNLGVVVERSWTRGDSDLFFFLCDDDFQNPNVVFADLSTQHTTAADVGFVAGADKWVVAFEKWNGQAQNCFFHRHNSGDLTVSTQVTGFTAPLGAREGRPKIGGRRGVPLLGAGSVHALLVREREAANTTGNTGSTEVWASLLDVTTGTEQSLVRIGGGMFGADAEAPAVSKDSGGGPWVVAYQGWSGLAATRWNTVVRQVGPDGTLASGSFVTDRAAQPQQLLAPLVDGRHGRYLVAFAVASAATHPGKIDGNGGESLAVQRFDWPEGSSAVAAHPSVTIASTFGRVMRPGGLSYDTDTGSHWALTWTTGLLSLESTRVQRLGYRGLPMEGALVSGSAVPSAITFDDDHDQFAIVYSSWSYDFGSGMAFHDATGVLFQYPALNAPVAYGQACGAGSVATRNAFRLGAEFPAVRLLGAPAGTFALLMLSLDDVDLPLDSFGLPGCRLLVDPSPGVWVGTLGMVANANGDASMTIALPETLGPMDAYFQWAFGAAGGGFATSRGLHVEVR